MALGTIIWLFYGVNHEISMRVGLKIPTHLSLPI